MNRLLIKQEQDANIFKEQFLEDIDRLFETLQEAYGLYEYVGHERFLTVKAEIERELKEAPFAFHHAVSVLENKLYSFIKDGHFRIGHGHQKAPSYSYAVRYSTLHGISVIDCKKF